MITTYTEPADTVRECLIRLLVAPEPVYMEKVLYVCDDGHAKSEGPKKRAMVDELRVLGAAPVSVAAMHAFKRVLHVKRPDAAVPSHREQPAEDSTLFTACTARHVAPHTPLSTGTRPNCMLVAPRECTGDAGRRPGVSRSSGAGHVRTASAGAAHSTLRKHTPALTAPVQFSSGRPLRPHPADAYCVQGTRTSSTSATASNAQGSSTASRPT